MFFKNTLFTIGKGYLETITSGYASDIYLKEFT
jgi:hypothetical protein